MRPTRSAWLRALCVLVVVAPALAWGAGASAEQVVPGGHEGSGSVWRNQRCGPDAPPRDHPSEIDSIRWRPMNSHAAWTTASLDDPGGVLLAARRLRTHLTAAGQDDGSYAIVETDATSVAFVLDGSGLPPDDDTEAFAVAVVDADPATHPVTTTGPIRAGARGRAYDDDGAVFGYVTHWPYVLPPSWGPGSAWTVEINPGPDVARVFLYCRGSPAAAPRQRPLPSAAAAPRQQAPSTPTAAASGLCYSTLMAYLGHVLEVQARMGNFEDTGDDPAAWWAALGRDLAAIDDEGTATIAICAAEGEQQWAEDIATARTMFRWMWNIAGRMCEAEPGPLDCSVVGFPPQGHTDPTGRGN